MRGDDKDNQLGPAENQPLKTTGLMIKGGNGRHNHRNCRSAEH